MHELAICQGLIDQIRTLARQHDAKTVSRIYLSIGPLSGVEPPLLEQAFTIAQAGTVAEQAKLVIESLPIRIRCTQCGNETETSPNRLLCGHCGNWRTELISGDEMLLTSVELEQEQNDHV